MSMKLNTRKAILKTHKTTINVNHLITNHLIMCKTLQNCFSFLICFPQKDVHFNCIIQVHVEWLNCSILIFTYFQIINKVYYLVYVNFMLQSKVFLYG